MTSDDVPTDPGPDGPIRYEWRNPDRPSTTLIDAIATTTDRDPMAMSPLYQWIDPEALDALVSDRDARTAETVTITFSYDDVLVTIDSTGGIELRLPAADRE